MIHPHAICSVFDRTSDLNLNYSRDLEKCHETSRHSEISDVIAPFNSIEMRLLYSGTMVSCELVKTSEKSPLYLKGPFELQLGFVT